MRYTESDHAAKKLCERKAVWSFAPESNGIETNRMVSMEREKKKKA